MSYVFSHRTEKQINYGHSLDLCSPFLSRPTYQSSIRQIGIKLLITQPDVLRRMRTVKGIGQSHQVFLGQQ